MMYQNNPIQMQSYANQMNGIASQLQALQQPFQQVSQPISQPQYVNGRQSADAFQMQPNTTVILWDSNEPIFYVKQADASGFCSIKSFRFTEVEDAAPVDVKEFVTKKEFDDFKNSLNKRNNFVKNNGGGKNESN